MKSLSVLLTVCLFFCWGELAVVRADGEKEPAAEKSFPVYEKREISGWTLHVHPQLLQEHGDATELACKLLKEQLEEIVRVVPGDVVKQLREVPLWFSPVYAGTGAHAEYHPDVTWLRDQGRNPALVKCVEFTNVLIFEKELKRMPNFALHELAHAYHDRVLGFDDAAIRAAYGQAKQEKLYDRVPRNDGRRERAYAMTNHKEYFAETSEAFFSRNDFFPFNNEELLQHDPRMHRVLSHAWRVEPVAKQAEPAGK